MNITKRRSRVLSVPWGILVEDVIGKKWILHSQCTGVIRVCEQSKERSSVQCAQCCKGEAM